MEELFKQLMNEMREFRSDVNKRFESFNERLEEAVNRIESSQPHDIITMLKRIDRKLDHKDSELIVLNKRVFKTEADIERLSKQ